MAWSLAAWVLASSLFAGVPLEGLSVHCEPGNTVPPDCVITFVPDLGDDSPYGLIAEVGTGGVVHWCLGVVDHTTTDGTSFGGGLALDPPQARITASCRLF